MYPPYELDGHRLVDGLALVPVPTAEVAEAGADLTVSVNLMAHETLASWPGHAEPPPEPEPARKRYRMLDTLLEVMDLAQLDTSVRDAALADVVVTPRFGPGSWRDFELAGSVPGGRPRGGGPRAAGAAFAGATYLSTEEKLQ